MTLRDEIVSRASRLAALSSEFELKFDPPTTAKEVAWRESQLELKIPEDVTTFATSVFSRMSISWTLDAQRVDESQFQEGFPSDGAFEFNFFDLTRDSRRRLGDWIESADDEWPFAADDVLPLESLANGDYIVAVVRGSETGAIYYFDHESSEDACLRLASSFNEYITALTALSFPMLDDLDVRETFYNKRQKSLSTTLKISRAWESFIRGG